MTETVRHARIGRRSHRAATALFWIGCLVLPIALFCATAAWGGVYPFGGESFLTEDLKYQYIDFFTWYRGVLTGEHSIFYSFAQSLGSNTWGLYSYYLASPFNLLIVLFSEDRLTLAIFIITGLKLGCIGLAMGYFLRRRFELPYAWSLLLAVSFAFSGWVVTQLRNPMWLDALILLPLGALACWRLIRTGRFLALALVVAADIICCWYMAYMSVLFFCLYVLLELAVHVSIGNQVHARWVLGRALRFTAALLLGLALSAWTFVPTVFAMLGGTSSANTSGIFACTPTELAKSLLPGLWTYGTPQFYTGLVTLIAAVLFLLNARIPGRLRIVVVLFAGLMVASSVLKPLQNVWCGFREPNGFYARTAFLASFTMVWMAAYCVRCGWCAPWTRVANGSEDGSGRKGNSNGSGSEGSPGHRPLLQRPPVARFRLTRCRLVVVVLLLVTIVELAFNAHRSWNQLYVGYTQEAYDGYVAEASSQLAELRDYDDSPFYRIDKTYTRAGEAALNEGLAQGFNQLSSYSSASNSQAVTFLNALGYSSEGEFSTRYSTPILATDSLLGVRYASATGQPTKYLSCGLSTLSNGATFWQNPYALSLGFACSELDSSADPLAEENPFERQNALFRALTGLDEDLYSPLDVAQTGERSWDVVVPAGTIGYAYVVCDPDAGSYWSVGLEVSGTTYLEGWRFDHTLRALNGEADASQTIPVSIVPWTEAGASPDATVPEATGVVFYGLDLEVFERFMDALAQEQLSVTAMEDDHVLGTITTSQAEDLVLSVPYDTGWMITVNGSPVEATSLFDGGMMSIPVEAGENTIEMTYRSPGLTGGIIVSGIAGVLCVAIGVKSLRGRRG